MELLKLLTCDEKFICFSAEGTPMIYVLKKGNLCLKVIHINIKKTENSLIETSSFF